MCQFTLIVIDSAVVSIRKSAIYGKKKLNMVAMRLNVEKITEDY